MLYFEIVYQLVLPETFYSLASMTKFFSNLSLWLYSKNLIHKLLPLSLIPWEHIFRFSFLVQSFLSTQSSQIILHTSYDLNIMQG